MNASVVGDSLVIRRQINLGIAMDSDEGLLVPVIKAAETMSVVGLAREMERLRRKVQEKKITADDLSGGSFTLSNPGREGNLSASRSSISRRLGFCGWARSRSVPS